MSNPLPFVILIAVVVIGWFLIRGTIFNSIDDYYGYVEEDLHQEKVQIEERFVSHDELKHILDKAYISASEVLASTESAKSILELEKGMKYLREAIKERNILAGDKPDRLPMLNFPKPTSIVDPKEFCPEKDTGPKWDYPFYLKNIPSDPNCIAPPLKDLVTIVFNFINEIPISKAAVLFEDAIFCMYNDLNFVALVKSGAAEIPRLKEIAKSKLPNMNFVEQESAERTQGAVLHEALSKVNTKYVVLTRNTERFDNFSAIVRLVRDISLNKAVVIGGAHRNTSGHWKAGCYQMKSLRGELSFDEGYDLSDNGCMFCDYVSGPFGVAKDFFTNYLSTKKESKLKGDFFYMEFFSHVRLNLHQKIYMCIDSMFYTETSGLLAMEKTKWQTFQSDMGISKITLSDHKTSYEFTCEEVNLKCLPERDRDLPFCCFKSAKRILSQISNFLNKNQVQYQLHLPGVDETLHKLYNDNVKKNTVLIGVSDTNVLRQLKIDGFSWSFSAYELSSSEWRFAFMKESKMTEVPFNVKFDDLLLPVNSNPGKALLAYGNDACTRDKICFNVLHYYGTLDSQRVWL